MASTKARLAIKILPAPGSPGSSALALAFGAVTSGSVWLLGGNGLVLSGRRVSNIGLGDRGGLGLGNVDSRGVRNISDHGLGFDPGLRRNNWLLGADLIYIHERAVHKRTS